MKKIFLASALFIGGLAFFSCSSDDDSGTGSNNPMVGEWTAVNITYEIPGMGTHTVPFSAITDGCDVDELELKADNSADLETEAKVDGVCVESHSAGTWNDNSVTITGEENPRSVVSVSNSELQLKYVMTYEGYGTTEVVVSYSK